MPTKQADLLTALKMMTLLPAAGAGVGGLIGATRAEKGKRLRTALGDAGVGALAGLGFGLGGSAGGAAGMALGGKTHPGVAEQNSAALGGLGAGLGAVSAGMLGQKLRKEMEEEYDSSQNPFAAAAKIGSYKQAVGDDYYMPVGNTALIGAGIGGVLGGMSAPKGKTLKRMLGGAAIGGLGGAGMALGSNATKGVMNDLAPTEEPSLTRSLLPRLVGTGGALLGVGLGEKIHQDLEDAEEMRRPVVNIIHVPHEKKKHKAHDTEKEAKSLEEILFKNPYVPRATDFNRFPRRGDLDAADTLIPSNLPIWALTGGGIGSLIGAARAEKGKRLRGALRGGAVGAGAGVLGSFGARGAAQIGDIEMAYHQQSPENLPTLGRAGVTAAPYIVGGLGAGLGGVMMNRSLDHADEIVRQQQEKKEKDKKTMKTEKQALETPSALRDAIVEGLPWAVPRAAAIGAASGGLYGGLTGKGAIRGALRGGLIGGGAGAGATVGTGAAFGLSEDTGLADAMFGKMPEPKNFGDAMMAPIGRSVQHSVTTMPVGVAAGGVAGGLAGNKLYELLERGYDNRKSISKAYNKTPKKKNDESEKSEKKSAALSFGEKVAAGFDMRGIMNSGLGGAALGAGLGGLYGLMAPGEDGEGKRRGRLSGALRGALGGGLLGGGAAALGEAASPGFGRGAYDYAHGLYNSMFGKKQRPVLEPLAGQTMEEYQNMLADNPFYQQTGRMNTPNALSGNYLPQYGVPNGRIGPPVQ